MSRAQGVLRKNFRLDATLGSLIARSVSSTGDPTTFVFRAGSTDVFSMPLTRGAPNERLSLGPLQNLASQARNTSGMSSPNSANYASFRAELERMRNDSLRLNAGVQTDNDAKRAWEELVTNINDPAVVRQRLAEIQQINVRGMALREALVQNRRTANGLPELDTQRFRDPGPDATAAPGNAAPRTAAPASGGGGWSIRPAQ